MSGWVTPTLIVATLGSLLGAFVLYALGRWGGRGLALRYRSVLRVKEADLERAERWFDRYDEAVVCFGRMVPGLRSVVSIPAGMLRMQLGRFALLSAAGAALWDALLLGLGRCLVSNWRQVTAIAGSASNVVLAVALVALAWRSGGGVGCLNRCARRAGEFEVRKPLIGHGTKAKENGW